MGTESLHKFIMREAAVCSRMKPKWVLTAAQTKVLLHFDERGLYTPRLDSYKNKLRMLERLQQKGLVTPYRHGGWELTAIGCKAFKELAP